MSFTDAISTLGPSIQAILRQRLEARRYADDQRQQAFENARQTAGDARAQQQLDATTAATKLQREGQLSQQQGVEADRQDRRAETSRESWSPGAFVPDATAQPWMKANLPVGDPVAAQGGVAHDFQGPIDTGASPETQAFARAGHPSGFLLTPTSKQADRAAGEADKAAGRTRQDTKDASDAAALTVTQGFRAREVAAAELRAKNMGNRPSGAGGTDIPDVIAGMKDGTLPPQLPGRATHEYTSLLAEAHRQGYDLATAATDWVATQKHIATLNGPQQTRLNQAIGQLPELLDSVESLATQWQGGRFPILNKASLALAKNGAYGQEVASVATQLEQQITDVTADLGMVYMGGNSPTDHALTLASTALRGEWSQPVLLDMVRRARANVAIRQNSIRHTGVQGASPNNPYSAQPAGGGAASDPGGINSTGGNWVDGGNGIQIRKK